jgi:hypothetical protein
VGLLAIAPLLGIVALMSGSAIAVLEPPGLRIYVTSGAVLARAGATSVVWRRRGEVLRQTCRGVCDDVTYWAARPRAARVDGADAKPSADWVRTLRAPPR